MAYFLLTSLLLLILLSPHLFLLTPLSLSLDISSSWCLLTFRRQEPDLDAKEIRWEPMKEKWKAPKLQRISQRKYWRTILGAQSDHCNANRKTTSAQTHPTSHLDAAIHTTEETSGLQSAKAPAHRQTSNSKATLMTPNAPIRCETQCAATALTEQHWRSHHTTCKHRVVKKNYVQSSK